MVSSDQLPYLLALHRINGLGPIRLKHLLDHFLEPKLAWEASKKDWLGISIPTNTIESWQQTKSKLDPVSYTQKILNSGVKIKTIFDTDYPEILTTIYDPPLVIYYQGQFPQTGKAMAIVGSRKITGYGRIITEKFAKSLAEAGLVIVSGLARGVDAAAHQAAIKISGRVVAVLGGGLSKIYPYENASLASEILEVGGALISEFPPDFPHLPGNFPARNRIISGLSLGVLVTEAAQDSGSLITAKEALDQGREVFAIPGPITSETSAGTALLIKQGASLVTDPQEILDELGVDVNLGSRSLSQTDFTFSEIEKQILSCLENEQKHIDEICRETKIVSSEVSSSLIKMEIRGFVKSLGAGVYLKI